MRLNRYLAACGFGSRRSCEAIILGGKVSINGHFIRELATQVVGGDVVLVAGREAKLPVSFSVIALNKPRGFVTTASDEKKRKTVYDLLPPHFRKFGYIGRLDKESEGLLLFTDDGALARRLSSPRSKVEKEYEVILDKAIEPEHIDKLRRGFHIIGGRAKMEEIRRVSAIRLRVVLTQGIKRQIRLMFYELGYEVERLCRLRIGSVELGDMPVGHYRALRKAEVEELGG